MKLQPILLLTGIAAGLMTVSCQYFQSTTDKEAEEFFGRPAPSRAKAEAQDAKDFDYDFYNQVNTHIDRRLNEFNEKEEVKTPIFVSKEAMEEFRNLSFIRTADQISLLSMDFSLSGDSMLNLVIDRESRTLTRKIDDKEETFTFEPFTNGIPPAIPYYAHILYAFGTDFNRIAESVTLRCYEKLEHGENPGIAQIENEANIDEKGNKIDKNFVELKPKVVTEPQEYRIDNRWCKCYDVKLKSICAPATALAIYVSNEEKTVARLDVIFDDDSKSSYIIDWREQDGIVLPRIIRRLEDNAVYFRRDANVILKSHHAEEEAEAAAEEAAEEDQGAADQNASQEDDMIEIDAAADDADDDASEETDDGFGEDISKFYLHLI